MKDLIVRELKQTVKLSPIRDEIKHMKTIIERGFWLSIGFVIGVLSATSCLSIYLLLQQ